MKLLCFYIWISCFLWVFPSFLCASLIEISPSNSQLIVSNYPEEIKSPGVILDEWSVTGPVRVLYFHKNTGKANLQIGIRLKNRGAKKEIGYCSAMAGPSGDGISVGYQITQRFFLKKSESDYTTEYFNPLEEKYIVIQPLKPGQVSGGMIEFEDIGSQFSLSLIVFDQMYPHLTQNIFSGYEAGVFDRSLFKERIDIDCKKSIYEISIGDEPFLFDSKQNIELKGNYGAWYDFDIVIDNQNHTYQDFSFFFSPTSGVIRGILVIDGFLLDTGLIAQSDPIKPQKFYQFCLKPQEKRQISLKVMPQPGSFYPVQVVIRNQIKYFEREG